MSFLWTINRSNKKTIVPSPTDIKDIKDQKSRKKHIIPKRFARKISSFASFLINKKLRAGMTVEASVVLPLFIFFFLHLASYMEMLRLHGKLTLALWDAGKKVSAYAVITEESKMDVPDMAVSYFYVQNHVKNLLGKEYLDTSPLVYGSGGLNYLACDYDEDFTDIAVTYQVHPQITVYPFPYMRMVNRYYGRVWSGYDVEKEMPEYVYVTIYGEVWHETTDCRYLDIEVYGADREQAGELRNAGGRKYRLCELCEDEEWKAQIYYTPQGECYHKDRECSSLIRYIRAVEWQEHMPYRACSNCVKESGK